MPEKTSETTLPSTMDKQSTDAEPSGVYSDNNDVTRQVASSTKIPARTQETASVQQEEISASHGEAQQELGTEVQQQEGEEELPPPPPSLHRHVSLSDASDYSEEDYYDSSVSEESDYDSFNEESSYEPDLPQDQLQRNPSVIAIGLPATAQHDHAGDDDNIPHEPTTQEAVSEAVAHDIAEREHTIKQKAKQAPDHHKMAARRTRKSLLEEDDINELQQQQLDMMKKSDAKQKASLQTLEQDVSKKRHGEFPRLAAPYATEPELVAGESNVYGTRDEAEEDEEDLEAQAGIPVVIPGAFAMEGMDFEAGRQHTGYDSGFDDDSEEEESEEGVAPPLGGEEEQPVEGELHDPERRRSERMLLDGIALNEDEVPLEEGDLKVPLKVRLLQGTVFLGILAVVGAIVGVVVSLQSGKGSNQSSANSNLVGWTQVGRDFRGTQTNKDGSFVGSAVSLSADGSRIVVNSPGWDESQSRLDFGQAVVYDWNGASWEPVGQELIGPGPRTTTTGSLSLSQSVALSKDGRRVAVGSPDWNEGQVSVYQEDSNTWNIVGQSLTGGAQENGRFGYAVALSSDGSVVAVGSPFAHSTEGQEATGVVRVFQEQSGDNSSWVQLGQDLVGDGEFELNGWSIALSGNGTRVVVGSPGSGVVGGFTGAARAYEFDGMTWTPMGRTLVGDAIQDRFGHSLSFSDDGSVLAVGGWEKPGPSNTVFVGHARIFAYSEQSNDFVQLGKDLVGTESYQNFGYSVALSANGMEVAVGSPRSNSISGGLSPRGEITAFSWDGNDWQKQPGTIGGSEDFENLGHSVSISENGKRVAGGAPMALFDSKFSNVGKAGVYDSA